MPRAFLVTAFRSFVPGMLALAIASSFSIPVHAQSITNTDPMTLTISPEYPAPYQTITVTPSSSSFDISGAAITASANGTVLYKGTGGQGIPVTVGGLGSVLNLKVTAVVDGQTYTETQTIRPAVVALVVEPISTTHPFYAGIGLVTSNARVRLIAVPDLRTSSGKALDPSTLVYSWKLGDQQLAANSGIGQSVLTATAPVEYRDADVTVTVSSQDGSVVAQAETTITPTEPIARIYENDPLLGPLFDAALSGNVTMSDTEDTFRAVPYYFAGTPTLSWSVNGSPSGSVQDITVRSSGNGQGTALLGFIASETDNSTTANSSVSVTFGQKSGGLFGL